jgi:hypothetical protein
MRATSLSMTGPSNVAAGVVLDSEPGGSVSVVEVF